MKNKQLTHRAMELLEEMISIPAPSSMESARCKFLRNKIRGLLREEGLEDKVIMSEIKDNILLYYPVPGKKTLMLCAHIDTVKPSGSGNRPLSPKWQDDRLCGLGANDDGASVVCMLEAFINQAKKRTGCQLLLALTCQEETGGKDGMPSVIEYLNNQSIIPIPDYSVVGEPTGMKAAVGEKGLLVLDGVATGTLSHAAHANPDNAIYKAMKDIDVLKRFNFRKGSKVIGPTHLSVTQINAGKAHNIVPDSCSFVVDIRLNERYTPEQVLEILSSKTQSKLMARNLGHRCRITPPGCILEKIIIDLGFETYVSPTSSDWARLEMPAIKIGPGESSRSHKADEYVTKSEIENGIEGYIKILSHPDLCK